MLSKKSLYTALSVLTIAGTLGVVAVGAQSATTSGTPTTSTHARGEHGERQRFSPRVGGVVTNLTASQFTVAVKTGETTTKEVTVTYDVSTTIVTKLGGATTTLANGQTVEVQSDIATTDTQTTVAAKRITVVDKAALEANSVRGTVQSVDGQTIVVKKEDGTTATVTLSSTTVVRISVENTGSLAVDLAGKTIGVNGDKQTDGSYVAKNVVIGSQGMGKGGEGFRGFPGKKGDKATTTPTAL
ncbi:MAG: DUF5666 domain-containing protein [bacterium]